MDYKFTKHEVILVATVLLVLSPKSKTNGCSERCCYHPMRCSCWCLSEEMPCQSSPLHQYSRLEMTSLSLRKYAYSALPAYNKQSENCGLALPGDSNFRLFASLTFPPPASSTSPSLCGVQSGKKVMGIVRSRNNVPQHEEPISP